MIYII